MTNTPNPTNHIQEFVDRAGSVEVARVMLGVSGSAVYAYCNGRRAVPPSVLVTLNLFDCVTKRKFNELKEAAELALRLAA